MTAGSFPRPIAGLVIRYSYLWRREQLRGQEEGVKDRPCAVILVTQPQGGSEIVTVLPITHSPPDDLQSAFEIPQATKKRLGLDSERSWVVLSEANRFVWPGPDLRFVQSGGHTNSAFGQLPYAFVEQIRLKFIDHIKARRAEIVSRTE